VSMSLPALAIPAALLLGGFGLGGLLWALRYGQFGELDRAVCHVLNDYERASGGGGE
jgi:cbb3-type cytochrome oxidase maturation protein